LLTASVLKNLPLLIRITGFPSGESRNRFDAQSRSAGRIAKLMPEAVKCRFGRAAKCALHEPRKPLRKRIAKIPG